MVVADIPSVGNIADIGTRPKVIYTDKEINSRRERTVELMERAVLRWRQSAEEYHQRPEENSIDQLDSVQVPDDEEYLW